MTPSPVPPPSPQLRRSGRTRKAVNKDIDPAKNAPAKNAPSRQQRNVVVANKSSAPSTTTTTTAATTTTETTTIATVMSDVDTAPTYSTTDQPITQQPSKKPKRTSNQLRKSANITTTSSLHEA